MPCGAPSSWHGSSYYVNHSKDNKAANARLMADIDLEQRVWQHLGQLDTDCIERFRICMECRLDRHL